MSTGPGPVLHHIAAVVRPAAAVEDCVVCSCMNGQEQGSATAPEALAPRDFARHLISAMRARSDSTPVAAGAVAERGSAMSASLPPASPRRPDGQFVA